jgi:translation initiation factor IF-2
MLASASNAIIIGFNVRPTANASSLAKKEKVDIRTYRIIYSAIEDIEAAMTGMLDPEYKEVELGKAEVRAVFKVPGSGMVAGSYVVEGKILRNASIRLVRDGIVIMKETSIRSEDSRMMSGKWLPVMNAGLASKTLTM